MAAPGNRPSAAAGEHRLRRGDPAGCPWPAFAGPSGWRRRGFAARRPRLRRTAGARLLQYSSASSSPTRSADPATRTWRCTGTSQCSTAAARGFAARSAPFSLSQSVKKTSPRRRPRSTTRRADGTPSLVAVAMVMASGIGWPAARAASSHRDSWRSGSPSRSVTSTRPVSRPGRGALNGHSRRAADSLAATRRPLLRTLRIRPEADKPASRMALPEER
jgi:hypothetical protein